MQLNSCMCHGCRKSHCTAEGTSVFPAGPESGHAFGGSANPYLYVNRILFIWMGQTYHTNKVGDLVPIDFLSLLSGESAYMSLLCQ